MTDQFSTNPVRLLGFPSCQNSLSWGGEHLAVAAGDTVHILTPFYTNKSFALTESVRVNRFSEAEWPHQDLAALGDLSIGEEQSECRIVSLAWSPPGLGLHKRSVLAVLTSNLVLSLWESNGKSGTWRRTVLLNDHNHGQDERAGFLALKRRSQRIRAFAWLPPLTHAHAPKWGIHLLAVVNDNNLLTFFHMRRGFGPQEGYEMDSIFQHQLSVPEVLEASDELSPLETLLITESRVSRIIVGPWSKGKKHDEKYPDYSHIQLTFIRGTDGGPSPKNGLIVKVRPTATGVVVEDQASTPVEPGPYPGDQSVVAGLEQAVAASLQEFNEKYRLRGYVRVRHWGHATDPTGKYVAAGITLHPSNMLESVDVSKDNILVLLVAAENSLQAPPTEPNAEQRIRRILSWVKVHASDQNVKSDLDVRLLRIMTALVAAALSQDSELKAWAQAAERMMFQPTTAIGAQDERNGDIQTIMKLASSPEACQWCGAGIPLGTNSMTSARCSNSHVFERCGLSFLSIQEPGISKHCARCGKEFLDTAKLEPTAGPSLILDLFEEFDVCPYCQGKFSG